MVYTKNRNMGLFGPCDGSMAHAKKHRRKESQSLLCCVGFMRGLVGFAVGGKPGGWNGGGLVGAVV